MLAGQADVLQVFLLVRLTRGPTYPLCATASTDGSYVYPRKVGAETWYSLIKIPYSSLTDSNRYLDDSDFKDPSSPRRGNI